MAVPKEKQQFRKETNEDHIIKSQKLTLLRIRKLVNIECLII